MQVRRLAPTVRVLPDGTRTAAEEVDTIVTTMAQIAKLLTSGALASSRTSAGRTGNQDVHVHPVAEVDGQAESEPGRSHQSVVTSIRRIGSRDGSGGSGQARPVPGVIEPSTTGRDAPV